MKDYDHMMGTPGPESFLTIEDERQARLLCDADAFHYFKPFLARESSVSAAAIAVNCDLDKMLYRVKVFQDAGLLVVARCEKRAGRDIKHYRSVAEAFFIPFAVTPYADIEEQSLAQIAQYNLRLTKSMARFLHDKGIYGRRIFRAEDGSVWRDAATSPTKQVDLDDPALPIGEMTSDNLMLTDEEARALQAELRDLWYRYSQLRNKQGERSRYLLNFAIVREVPE